MLANSGSGKENERFAPMPVPTPQPDAGHLLLIFLTTALLSAGQVGLFQPHCPGIIGLVCGQFAASVKRRPPVLR